MIRGSRLFRADNGRRRPKTRDSREKKQGEKRERLSRNKLSFTKLVFTFFSMRKYQRNSPFTVFHLADKDSDSELEDTSFKQENLNNTSSSLFTWVQAEYSESREQTALCYLLGHHFVFRSATHKRSQMKNEHLQRNCLQHRLCLCSGGSGNRHKGT